MMRRPLPPAAVAISIAVATLAGCAVAPRDAADHARAVTDPAGDRFTLGTVQRDIRPGMTGGEVAAVLGAPNIVTGGPGGTETWVYDRAAQETRVSSSSGAGVGLVFRDGVVGVGGNSGTAGAARTTSRSLTVVIDYDSAGGVRDVRYHDTRF